MCPRLATGAAEETVTLQLSATAIIKRRVIISRPLAISGLISIVL